MADFVLQFRDEIGYECDDGTTKWRSISAAAVQKVKYRCRMMGEDDRKLFLDLLRKADKEDLFYIAAILAFSFTPPGEGKNKEREFVTIENECEVELTNIHHDGNPDKRNGDALSYILDGMVRKEQAEEIDTPTKKTRSGGKRVFEKIVVNNDPQGSNYTVEGYFAKLMWYMHVLRSTNLLRNHSVVGTFKSNIKGYIWSCDDHVGDGEKEAEAEAKAEEQDKAAQAEKKAAAAQAEKEAAAAQAKKEADADAEAAREAKEKADAEVKTKAEEEAKIKAEAEAKAKAENEATIKAEEEAKAETKEEAKIKAEALRPKQEDAGQSTHKKRTKGTKQKGNECKSVKKVKIEGTQFSYNKVQNANILELKDIHEQSNNICNDEFYLKKSKDEVEITIGEKNGRSMSVSFDGKLHFEIGPDLDCFSRSHAQLFVHDLTTCHTDCFVKVKSVYANGVDVEYDSKQCVFLHDDLIQLLAPILVKFDRHRSQYDTPPLSLWNVLSNLRRTRVPKTLYTMRDCSAKAFDNPCDADWECYKVPDDKTKTQPKARIYAKTKWVNCFQHIRKMSLDEKEKDVTFRSSNYFQNPVVNVQFYSKVESFFTAGAPQLNEYDEETNSLLRVKFDTLMQYKLPIECASVEVLGSKTCSEQFQLFIPRFISGCDDNIRNRRGLGLAKQDKISNELSMNAKRLVGFDLMSAYLSYSANTSKEKDLEFYVYLHHILFGIDDQNIEIFFNV